MRRHLWVQAPIRVKVDGVSYAVGEWSLGGIVLAQPAVASPTGVGPGSPANAPNEVGRRVALDVALPFQGFEICFAAQGEVESAAPDNARTVIAFHDLGQRERELLSHFVEQLVRGNMAAVDDTIHRLGSPLTAAGFAAASTSDGPPTLARSAYRRPLRATAMTMAYAAAGVAATAYLGSLVYTNLFWLEAQTSVISAPSQALVSLGDGVVTWTRFKPGDAVKSGDVVLKIADTLLEREIELAEIAIHERENKLAFLARRLESEKKRLGAVAGLSTMKSAQMSAEIESLNVKLQSAKRELRQLPASASGPLAQVRQRIVALQQAIALKGLERNARANLSEDTSTSLEIVGQTVVGDLDNLAAQIELAEADIAIAQQRHQSYLNQRDRLAVRAPFDGILRDLTHADLSTLRKGDVAAVVERADQRTVTAYLRHDQLLRVQLGAEAVVHVPATRQTFKATVAEIDPARAASGHAVGFGGSPSTGPRRDEGMAAVRLTLATPVRSDEAGVYRDGLPAVTMIGLSASKTPWTPTAVRTTAALPAPAVRAAEAPATQTANEPGNWLSRAIGGTFGGWLRAPRPPAQLGG